MATAEIKAKIGIEGLGEVSQALRDLSSQMGDISKTSGVLKKDLEGVGDGLKKIGKESSDSKGKTGNFFKSIADGAKDAGKKIEKMGEKIQKAGEKTKKVGKALAPLSAAAAGILVGSVKGSMDFEDTMLKVGVIADFDKNKTKEGMRKEILKISSEMAVDANIAGDLVYNAISAGQATKDAGKFAQRAMKLATAGFAEDMESLNLLSTIINAYGLASGEVGRVSDILIKTQNVGRISVSEMAQSMGRVIPTANLYGIQIEELAAMYALLTKNGNGAAESTTYINSMLSELGKHESVSDLVLKETTGKSFKQLVDEGKSVADILKVLDKAAKDYNVTVLDLFGSKTAGQGAASILQDDLDSFVKEMKNSKGSTDIAYADITSSNSFKIEKSINLLKNSMIELGDVMMNTLAPIISDIAGEIAKFSSWFSELDVEAKESIVKMLMMVAAISPIIIMLGQVMIAIGGIIKGVGKFVGVIGWVIGKLGTLFSWIAGLLGVSVGWVVAIVAAVAAAAYLIIKYWDNITAFFSKWWEGTKEALRKFGDFLGGIINADFEKIKQNWQKFKDFLAKWIEQGKENWRNLFQFISDFVTEKIEQMKENWQKFKDFLTKWIEQGKENWRNLFQFVADFVTEKIEQMKQNWATFKEFFSNLWENIKTTVVEKWTSIKTFFSNTWSGIKDTATNVWEGIKNAIVSPINKARELIGQAIEKIKNIMKFDFKLPKLKLPHFSLSGGFSLAPPSTPKVAVDWYATGGIATGPSIVGIGEAGDEAILPLSNKSRMRPFADTVAGMIESYNQNKGNNGEQSGNVIITGNNFTIREEADIKKIAIEMNKLQQKTRRPRGRG